MKKLLLLLLTFTVAFAHAKKAEDLSLISGDPNALKCGEELYLAIDYSKTQCEGKPLMTYLKEKGDDWVRDWDGEQQTILQFFKMKFDKKFKKLGGTTVQYSNKASKYKLVFHVEKLNMGSTGGGAVASAFLGAFAGTAGGAKVSGTIELIDTEQNKNLLTVKVNDIQGEYTFSVTSRIGMAVYETALQLGDFVKKNK